MDSIAKRRLHFQPTDTELIHAVASMKIKLKKAKSAAADYEKLVKSDPTNTTAIAGLIMAFAEYDLNSAEKYLQHLPSHYDLSEEVINEAEIESVASLAKLGSKKAFLTGSSACV
jgi:thioredoxin-like negative regulator of GroEL